MIAPVVAGPRDVPALREWMLLEWYPPNAFSRAAERMVLGKASVEDAQTAIVWNLQSLAVADLWYVDEAMSQLVQESSIDLPPVVLRPELVPAEPVLVVFEKPLVGTDADAAFAGRPVAVDAMMWATATLKMAGPCIAVTLYSRMRFDAAEEFSDLDLVGDLGGELWVPLGTTHWAVGASWSDPLLVELDASTATSMAEDRKWLATLWSLAREPKIAETREDRGHRGDRRRAEREGRRPPTVNVVSLRRSVHENAGAVPSGSGREYHVRWPVKGHWRQQPYGPERKFRRPQFIAPYVKGPEGAPLRKGATVKVLRDD